MIQVTSYFVSCDGCGEEVTSESGQLTDLLSVQDFSLNHIKKEEALKGWAITKKVALCPTCKKDKENWPA